MSAPNMDRTRARVVTETADAIAEERGLTAPHPDQSLEIAIHLSSAKAIADIIHICTGCAIDGSESRLDELDVQTLPALVCAIRRHIEEAEELQSRQRAEVAS